MRFSAQSSHCRKDTPTIGSCMFHTHVLHFICLVLLEVANSYPTSQKRMSPGNQLPLSFCPYLSTTISLFMALPWLHVPVQIPHLHSEGRSRWISVSSRPTWSTEQVPGQVPKLEREILSRKTKTNKQTQPPLLGEISAYRLSNGQTRQSIGVMKQKSRFLLVQPRVTGIPNVHFTGSL